MLPTSVPREARPSHFYELKPCVACGNSGSQQTHIAHRAQAHGPRVFRAKGTGPCGLTVDQPVVLRLVSDNQVVVSSGVQAVATFAKPSLALVEHLKKNDGIGLPSGAHFRGHRDATGPAHLASRSRTGPSGSHGVRLLRIRAAARGGRAEPRPHPQAPRLSGPPLVFPQSEEALMSILCCNACAARFRRHLHDSWQWRVRGSSTVAASDPVQHLGAGRPLTGSRRPCLVRRSRRCQGLAGDACRRVLIRRSAAASLGFLVTRWPAKALWATTETGRARSWMPGTTNTPAIPRKTRLPS